MMILPYFENLISGIEATLADLPEQAVRARKTLALQIARLGVRLFSGNERVAWCGVLVPFDLLHAMDVTPCFAEFVGAMLASTGGVEPMLARAEQEGYSTDGCSYHRSVLGATHHGLMPEPDFLIASSAPCTGGVAVIENLARHFGKDLFVLNIPHHGSEADVDYLALQLREMVDFVARHTGQPLDPDRLRQAMERTNQTRQLLVETYALAQTVPSPARQRDLVNFGLVVSLLLGSETAVNVARIYRDEFARKVEAGIAGMDDEQIRLMWLQNRIQFKSPLEDVLAREHHAAVVLDELNDICWDPIDPEDPYDGLARRILSIPLMGNVQRRVARLQTLARDYRVDGAINPCNWGCRQGSGARGLIEAGLREVDVPVLNLEVDCIDSRNFAPGQLATRLEAFMELIRSRKDAGGQDKQ